MHLGAVLLLVQQLLQAGDALFGMGQDFARYQGGRIVGLVGAQVTDLLLQTPQPLLQLQ